MLYSFLAMLGSWDQPRVRGPFNRFSGSFRGLVSRFGSVVQLIIWVNVAVFFIQLLCSVAEFPYFDWLFALSGDGVARGFLWQPLTYMFLHGGIWHILINLLILWFIGREVEYFIGPNYFLRLYLLGGVVGALLWLAFNFHSPSFVVGASAGVLASVIAFATLFPNREITLLVFFVLPVTMKAKYLAIALVALDVVPLMQHTQTSVAHLAHVGGAALGYVYIKHLGYGATPGWLRWIQNIARSLRARTRQKPVERSTEDFLQEEVDPILDKIAREGMHSLTHRERKILESAKDLIEKRPR